MTDESSHFTADLGYLVSDGVEGMAERLNLTVAVRRADRRWVITKALTRLEVLKMQRQIAEWLLRTDPRAGDEGGRP